ncbi:MAG: hypothetical protein F6K11_11485 [Leptolyngbya sp. SIO3F4]|nr:hypothetical protein [Leptolyngbya sp. SIO3F4]
MIAFKDFVPEQVSAGGLFSSPEYEMLEKAVAQANDWIETSEIKVLNIETVILPNIYKYDRDGSTDSPLLSSGENATTWHQIVRVWYHAE